MAAVVRQSVEAAACLCSVPVVPEAASSQSIVSFMEVKRGGQRGGTDHRCIIDASDPVAAEPPAKCKRAPGRPPVKVTSISNEIETSTSLLHDIIVLCVQKYVLTQTSYRLLHVII